MEVNGRSREELFEEARKQSMALVARIDDMMLAVVKAQVTVEAFMIELLNAYGKDPAHCFFTSQKIRALRDIDPPEVGLPMWELLSLCSYVRNELVHSLDPQKVKQQSDKVREAYLSITESERQKKSVREMTDTQMVTSAIYHCGSLVVIATEAKITANRAKPRAG
ncbi:MAG TPA: hypothetical protein VHC94_12910 [Nitrobacter sp.]|jgi:hypothetical protein|nr:hypothetical protein [Nitrobacter sp.]